MTVRAIFLLVVILGLPQLATAQGPQYPTTPKGLYEIGQIPDGTYVIEARHEVLGTLTREVTIAGGRATADFGFGD